MSTPEIITVEDVKEACIRLWGEVPEEIENMQVGGLGDLLAELDVEHPEARVEWSNIRRLTHADVVRLCAVQVERLVCDNCGEVEYRCHPPGDNWDHFQGCCSPHDIGVKFETSKGDVFVCTDCYRRNPAFQLLM